MPAKRKFFIKTLEVCHVVKKILDFFQKEKDNGARLISHPWKRLSKATGICERSLREAYHKADNERVAEVVDEIRGDKTPEKKTRPRKLDSFDEDTIRNKIYSLQRLGQFVSIRSITESLNDEGLEASTTTIYNTVKKLGFRFCKNARNRSFLLEKNDVIAKRHTYLRKVRDFRQQGKEIVYLDETWLNANHTTKGEWLNVPSTSTSVFEPLSDGRGRRIPQGKGSRLIILDVGSSRQGMIPDCALVFRSKTGSQDYHDEMNADCFTEWFKDTLLPKLNPASVIVMDDASYHSQLDSDSRVPNSSSRKSEIQSWLDRKHIHYDSTMIKAELLALVKRHKPASSKYIIDSLAEDSGHTVLRLPPYHCELNPIESIWAQIKGYVARKNSLFKIDHVKDLYFEARLTMDVEKWKKVEAHVIREVEEKLWNIDAIQEEIDPVRFDLTDDTDDEIDDDENIDNDTLAMHDETSYTQNDSDNNLLDSDNDSESESTCSICNELEPPNPPKNIRWCQCEYVTNGFITNVVALKSLKIISVPLAITSFIIKLTIPRTLQYSVCIAKIL